MILMSGESLCSTLLNIIVIDIILVLLEDEPMYPCFQAEPTQRWRVALLTSSDENPTLFHKNNVCSRSQEKSLRRVSKQPVEQHLTSY